MQSLATALADLLEGKAQDPARLTEQFLDLVVSDNTKVYKSPEGHRYECECASVRVGAPVASSACAVVCARGSQSPKIWRALVSPCGACPHPFFCVLSLHPLFLLPGSCLTLVDDDSNRGGHGTESKSEDVVEREEKTGEPGEAGDKWVRVSVAQASGLSVFLDPASHLPPNQELFAKV